MSQDLLGDGNIKVTVCLTLSSTGSPPATELNAGVDIQELLTKDGLGISPEQAAVDTTSLASRSETERGGTAKHPTELTYKRKVLEADDIAFTTLTSTSPCAATWRTRPRGRQGTTPRSTRCSAASTSGSLPR
jgi:hypothetical protein